GSMMPVAAAGAATATNPCIATGSSSLHELLLSSLHQREQQLMLDCRSVTGALAYILTAAPEVEGETGTGTVAVAVGTKAVAEADCCDVSSTSMPVSQERRPELTAIAAGDLVADDPVLGPYVSASACGSVHGSYAGGGGGGDCTTDPGGARLVSVSGASNHPLSVTSSSPSPSAVAVAMLPQPACAPMPSQQLLHVASLQRSRLGSSCGLNLRLGSPSIGGGGGGGGFIGGGGGGCGNDSNRRGASPLSVAGCRSFMTGSCDHVASASGSG
ncbi:hypothetical protein Vafri_21964, partial [Volvox africanus]